MGHRSRDLAAKQPTAEPLAGVCDAAKKVLGRKRVALLDADGTWLAVPAVPANTQDWDALEALIPGKQAWPSPGETVLDRAAATEKCHARATATA